MSTRRLIFFFALTVTYFLGMSVASAQWNRVTPGKQWGVGMVLRTTGVGLTFNQEYKLNQKGRRMLAYAELVTVKHPSEIKIVNQGAQSPTPYVYGKLYHTFMSRLGVGMNQSVISRTASNAIGFSVEGYAGLSVASLRPVYLDVMTYQANDKTPIIRSQRYDPATHTNQADIVGYSRQEKGWSEIENRLGGNLTLAARLDWGRSHIGKQVGVGVMVDYFPSDLPIMATSPNANLFATPFVRFMWYFSRG
ncbi:MAG: hypothetical protein H6608_10920 [Flavobacteriales bacterium]|nr:hypothetical protein [Flavobacteriales bacterium]